MDTHDADVTRYIRSTRLDPQVLAESIRCTVDDVEAMLAGKSVSDRVRENFAQFKERRERCIAAFAEGWDVLVKDGDDVWDRFAEQNGQPR